MMDHNKRKPSNFALSRYILDESDPEENRRIQSWMASSDDARTAFEEFKAKLTEEERSFIPLKQFHFKESKIFRLHWSKPAWATSFVVASFVAVAIFILPSVLSRNKSHDLFTHCPQPPVTQQTMTFRDTLETLLQMTSQMLMQSERKIQVADSQVNAVHSPQRIKRLPSYISGADQTAVILE
jgi:hypothetical protein